MLSTLKIMVLGAAGVGKSCLLKQYCGALFDEDYQPTIMDTYKKTEVIQKIPYDLEIIDTAGQHEYNVLKSAQFEEVDVFLICFNVASLKTLSEVKNRFAPLVKKHSKPDAKILLIGLQQDARSDSAHAMTQEKVAPVKQDLNAADYVECSAKNNANVQNVFLAAIRACEIAELGPQMDNKPTILQSITDKKRKLSKGIFFSVSESNDQEDAMEFRRLRNK